MTTYFETFILKLQYLKKKKKTASNPQSGTIVVISHRQHALESPKLNCIVQIHLD